MKFDMNDAYVLQAKGLCDYVAETSDILWDACVKTVTPDMKGIDANKIYITGCGDSYCAGIAMEPVFTELLGEATVTRPVRAIEVSRRWGEHRFDDKTLVVIISASGKPSRVVESARRSNRLGANTLAITSGAETPLGLDCKGTLVVPKPNVPHSPGLLSYVCSCLTLTYLAIVMGAVRGNYSMEQALAYKAEVEEYCASYAPHIDRIAEEMLPVAEKFHGLMGFDFFADRSDYATAYFAMAKYTETFGAPCTIDDSENWEHVNNFIVDTHNMATHTVVTHDSPSRSRVLEGIPVCERLERPLLVVTDIPEEELPAYGIKCILPQAKRSWMAPLMMHLPFNFLAFYIANMRGVPYFRNFEGPWSIPNKLGNSEMSE